MSYDTNGNPPLPNLPDNPEADGIQPNLNEFDFTDPQPRPQWPIMNGNTRSNGQNGNGIEVPFQRTISHHHQIQQPVTNRMRRNPPSSTLNKQRRILPSEPYRVGRDCKVKKACKTREGCKAKRGDSTTQRTRNQRIRKSTCADSFNNEARYQNGASSSLQNNSQAIRQETPRSQLQNFEAADFPQTCFQPPHAVGFNQPVLPPRPPTLLPDGLFVNDDTAQTHQPVIFPATLTSDIPQPTNHSGNNMGEYLFNLPEFPVIDHMPDDIFNSSTTNQLPTVNGMYWTDCLHNINGLPSVNGVPPTNGVPPANGLRPTNGVHPVNGVYPVNDVHPVNGVHLVNDLSPVNGVHPFSGVHPINRLSSVNGLRGMRWLPSANGLHRAHAEHVENYENDERDEINKIYMNNERDRSGENENHTNGYANANYESYDEQNVLFKETNECLIHFLG